jgi:hypothetical protein
MLVDELRKQLEGMPATAEVVVAESVEGAWTMLSCKVIRTKYKNTDVVVLVEGW